MMSKKDRNSRNDIDTVIGVNTNVEGNIECEGSLRIDGKVKGGIKAKGDALIGSAAIITGNITANDVHLSGTVNGNIYAGAILKIYSTAKLSGDIEVVSFVADEGALFEGKCCMIENEQGRNAAGDYKKSNVIEQADKG